MTVQTRTGNLGFLALGSALLWAFAPVSANAASPADPTGARAGYTNEEHVRLAQYLPPPFGYEYDEDEEFIEAPYRDEVFEYQEPRPRRRVGSRVRTDASPPAAFDLTVTARLLNEGCDAGESCTYSVKIRNHGPRIFRGQLWIRGQITPAVSTRIRSIGPGGWSCNQIGTTNYCSRRVRALRPGQSISLEQVHVLPINRTPNSLTACFTVQWRNATGGQASVQQIQRALAAQGVNPGPIDGAFGSRTRNAISRFQRQNGLRVTGTPTPGFVSVLFQNEMGYSRDQNTHNDRACARATIIGQGLPNEPDIPDDGSLDQSPQDFTTDDNGQDAAFHTKSVSRFHRKFTSIRHDKSTSRRFGEPAPPGGHRKSRSKAHRKSVSNFHLKAGSEQHEKHTSAGIAAEPVRPPAHLKTTSEFHKKHQSRRHDKTTSGPTEVHEKWKSSFHRKYQSSRHAKATSEPIDIHEKALSSFHAKQTSVTHDKATSGALRVHQKWRSDFHAKYQSSRHVKATSRPRPVHDKDLSAFHDKHNSSEHVKTTSTALKVHEKWQSTFHAKYASSRHVKATSKPRPVHQKNLSTFHAKGTSSQHDKTTTKVRVSHLKSVSAFHEKNASGQHDKSSSRGLPVHEKWQSTFHRKFTTDMHVKATSLPRKVHDKDMSSFHLKYKSLQHDKETSKLQKYHNKAVSSAVHSKARSAVTNP